MKLPFSLLRKITTIVLLLVLCCPNLTGQEKSNRKLGIETGFVLSQSDSEGLGLLFNIDPKVKIAENVFAGVRFGFTMNVNTYENFAPFTYQLDTRYDNAIISLTPNLEFYPQEFYWNERRVSPFVGLGLGYHRLFNVEVTSIGGVDPVGTTYRVDVAARLGFFLRGGVELRSLRLGLEYASMPKADLVLPDGQVVGKVDNRYLALSVGIVIGRYKRT